MSEEESNPSSGEAPASPTGIQRRYSLKNLLLDPNNYRFIDHPDYMPVPDEKISEPEIQRRTTNFILGRNNEEVRDLLASIRKNGWLPIDHIQVREVAKGKFLVVEGNRRVAALKHLERSYEEGGIDLGNLDPALFSAVPVVIYEDAGEAHHLVIMGLGHIGGKRKWPAINQARLLKKLITELNWSEQDVCAAISVSKKELRSTMKTLALCDIYRGSDYGDQFTSEKYNLFREVIRSREISAWIGWNEQTGRPDNDLNVNRLFSWFSREDDSSESDSGEARAPADPVINTGTEVRELARFINDDVALRALDETRQLSAATFSSDVMVQDRLSDGLRRINDSINILFSHGSKLTDQHLNSAEEAIQKMRGLLTARNHQPVILGQAVVGTPFNSIRQGHFTSLSIEKYRRFEGLGLSELRRVNIFVGPNNSGKTSLLEAVQLLVCQNNVTGLLDLVRLRGKVTENPPPLWIKEQIPSESRISGRFDTVPDNLTKVVIRNEPNAADVEDKSFYLTTVDIEASYGGHRQSSAMYLYDQRERVTKFTSSHVLCPVVFSSPFMQHDTEFLVSLFNRSVEENTKGEILKFIQQKLDEHFKDVNLTLNQRSRQFARFLVTHDKLSPAPDLTQFGEGLQRIFQIGLLFAYARGGIVLIDEFENAIHFSLLCAFTRFIQELAVKFDVQVFLTSHSKECVDAFVKNNHHLEDIAAYALRADGDAVKVYRYPGEQIGSLLESVDIDLRA